MVKTDCFTTCQRSNEACQTAAERMAGGCYLWHANIENGAIVR